MNLTWKNFTEKQISVLFYVQIAMPKNIIKNYNNFIEKDFIMDKTIFKKTGEELQEFLKFRKRGSKVKAKKGKGSFSRKQKHKNKDMR